MKKIQIIQTNELSNNHILITKKSYSTLLEIINESNDLYNIHTKALICKRNNNYKLYLQDNGIIIYNKIGILIISIDNIDFSFFIKCINKFTQIYGMSYNIISTSNNLQLIDYLNKLNVEFLIKNNIYLLIK